MNRRLSHCPNKLFDNLLIRRPSNWTHCCGENKELGKISRTKKRQHQFSIWPSIKKIEEHTHTNVLFTPHTIFDKIREVVTHFEKLTCSHEQCTHTAHWISSDLLFVVAMINGLMMAIFRWQSLAKQQLDMHLPQTAILLCVGIFIQLFSEYSVNIQSAFQQESLASNHIILLSNAFSFLHFSFFTICYFSFTNNTIT